LNKRHDDGAAFCDEDRVAEAFSFILEVLDGAETTLFTKESKFVKGCGALAFNAEAFGHEKEALFVGDGGECVTPSLVCEENAYVVAVNGIPVVLLEEEIGVFLEFCEREWGDELVEFLVVADGLEDGVSLRFSLGDIFFRLTKADGGGGDGR
jgi:hypothetical protein